MPLQKDNFLVWEQDFSKKRAPRDDLERSESDLEIGGVGLEVEESLGDARLELGGVLPRGAVGSDLVKGLGAHFDGWFDYVD
ncbi:unnamed protein product [Fusarium venenatum]|uniref:Uncharacterized protein n=1 Tax=Fusarium venenatum TaxID=56646 RepID=A0A2L2SPG4_9HYPO|nr:uncharacterized protein FVRRES_11281 [Fusarium venenatum]CEI38590.1 unnamed protein product [Fusarium venenatum]